MQKKILTYELIRFVCSENKFTFILQLSSLKQTKTIYEKNSIANDDACIDYIISVFTNRQVLVCQH